MSGGYKPAGGPLGSPPTGGIGVFHSTPQRWEYCTVYREIEDQELNKYGQDRWELVAVVPNSFGRASRYLFKRPLT